jgi:hypothetical protein
MKDPIVYQLLDNRILSLFGGQEKCSRFPLGNDVGNDQIEKSTCLRGRIQLRGLGGDVDLRRRVSNVVSRYLAVTGAESRT